MSYAGNKVQTMNMRIFTSLFFLFILSSTIPFVSMSAYELKAYALEQTTKEQIIDEMGGWYFHDINDSTVAVGGHPVLEDGLVGKAVLFDGKNDYLIVKNTEDKNVPSGFTLSAWVKPDYAKSSNVLTVFHSKNSFELVIENYGSRHVAKFSIFDGMKWTSVWSNTEIPEEWTNIVATYDKNQLSIYVNGNLDATKSLYETIQYYAYNKKVEKITNIISGPTLLEDLFIGVTNINSGLSSFFAGQIDEAQFYQSPTLVITGKPELKIDNTYVLHASNCSDTDVECNIELEIHTEGTKDDKVSVSIKNGIVSFSGIDYKVQGKDWSGTIPLKGGQTTLGGLAIGPNGQQIRIILVGIFVENTLDGPIFRASGSLRTADSQFGLNGQFELKSTKPIYKGLPEVVQNEPPPSPSILLITKQYTSTYVGNYFKFDVKVYYKDQNVLKEYLKKGGEVEDATVSLTIVDSDNKVLKTFEGHTNKNGHYANEFVVPKYVTPGVYSVKVTATKDGAVDINDLTTIINYEPRPRTPQNSNEPQSSNEPEISLLGADPQTIEAGSAYTELGATASDAEDGDISSSIVVDSSSVNTAVVGSYSVTYTVTDTSGNTTTKTRTVNVVDTMPPVITLLGDNPQVILVNSAYTELGATASDNYDGDISSSIVISPSSVDTFVIGTHIITYTVMDSSGNMDEKTRTVIVVGVTP